MPRTPRLCSFCDTATKYHVSLSGPGIAPQLRADVASIRGDFPAIAEGSVVCDKCQKVFRECVKLKEKVNFRNTFKNNILPSLF